MNTRLVENISDQELKIYDSLNIIREGNIRETHGDKSYDFVRGVKMRSDVSSIAEERNREKENGGGLERRVGGRGVEGRARHLLHNRPKVTHERRLREEISPLLFSSARYINCFVRDYLSRFASSPAC